MNFVEIVETWSLDDNEVCVILIIRLRYFHPFMPSGLFYLESLGKSISYIKGAWLVFIIIMFRRNF